MQADFELPNIRTHLNDNEREFIRENWGILTPPRIAYEINKKRLRKVSVNKVKCVAWAMGVFITESKYYHHKEALVSEDKLTVKDREFVKKQFRQGKPVNLILAAVNAPKDIKLTEEELSNFIASSVAPINSKANKRIVFTDDEIAFLKKNAGKMSCRLMADRLNAFREIKMVGQTVRAHLVKMGLKSTM